MNILDNIQKYLPQDLWDIAIKYKIHQNLFESSLDVIEMILRSKAIKNKYKQNYITFLSIMNIEQISILKNILIKEKQKFIEIENKYEIKKIEIKKKYLWKKQKVFILQKTKKNIVYWNSKKNAKFLNND